MVDEEASRASERLKPGWLAAWGIATMLVGAVAYWGWYVPVNDAIRVVIESVVGVGECTLKMLAGWVSIVYGEVPDLVCAQPAFNDEASRAWVEANPTRVRAGVVAAVVFITNVVVIMYVMDTREHKVSVT